MTRVPMAHITNAAPIAWPAAFFAAIGRAFQSVYLAMMVSSTYDNRMKEIQRLNALSDAELAEEGLSRDRIVHHVFRDLYYV